jgi:hypothetical protein
VSSSKDEALAVANGQKVCKGALVKDRGGVWWVLCMGHVRGRGDGVTEIARYGNRLRSYVVRLMHASG